MYPVPGHLSMGFMGSKISGFPLTPILLATFLPDIFDKILADIIVVAPYGRCYFHTLASIILISGVLYWFVGKNWAIGWAIGHFLHLLGDIGFIPWFYPFIDYHWPDSPNVTMATVDAVKEVVRDHKISSNTLKVYVPVLLIVELVLLAISILCLKFWDWQKNKIICLSILALFMATYFYRITYMF